MRLSRSLIVVIALAAASADAFALRFSLAAMDCCLKAHHACAGVKTADDCCQGMGHGIGPTASTGPVVRAHVVRADVAVLVAIAVAASVDAFHTPADPLFKRPHDPPHLHPVPLLI